MVEIITQLELLDNDKSEQLAFCENCQSQGVISELKQRIYLDEKGKLLPSPQDSDSFRQCWTCGTVVKLRDVKLSGSIKQTN